MRNGGPVGKGDYVVQAGDCMQSIANQSGFLWHTLWNLPENADLKRQRQPNVLLPGDLVTVPEIRLREQNCATDQQHRFVLLRDPCQFQLRFLDDQQQPRSGVAYTLTIDGQTTNGSLDGAGSLNVSIHPDASQGTITLHTQPDPETYPLNFGHLDPNSSITGVRGRLNNLGFSCASDGDWGTDLKWAIMRFQIVNNMQPTGQLDDQTKQALQQEHQS
jgi:hypothetical protein